MRLERPPRLALAFIEQPVPDRQSNIILWRTPANATEPWELRFFGGRVLHQENSQQALGRLMSSQIAHFDLPLAGARQVDVQMHDWSMASGKELPLLQEVTVFTVGLYSGVKTLSLAAGEAAVIPKDVDAIRSDRDNMDPFVYQFLTGYIKMRDAL